MRTIILIGVCAAIAAAFPSPAFAQDLRSADAACYDESDTYAPAAQIAGCTRLIESGRYSRNELADLYYNRAYAYGDKGDDRRALADYTRAIRLNPSFDDAYFNRAFTYARLGRHDRAIADYSETIRLDPGATNAFKNRARSFGFQGRIDEAIADYDEVLRRDPYDSEVYDRRGIKLLMKGEFVRALEDFNKALSLMERADFYYDRGVAELRLGRTAEGNSDIARAIRMNPKVAKEEASYGVKP